MATHRKLTTEARFAILRKLAAFQGPTEIAAAIQEEFGFEIRPQSIEHYDPQKNESLDREWADYFYEQRRKYLEAHDDEPMESRRYRQSERHKLYQKTASPKFKASILNDATEEALAWEKLAMTKGVGSRTPSAPLPVPPVPTVPMKAVEAMSHHERARKLIEILEKGGFPVLKREEQLEMQAWKEAKAREAEAETLTEKRWEAT